MPPQGGPQGPGGAPQMGGGENPYMALLAKLQAAKQGGQGAPNPMLQQAVQPPPQGGPQGAPQARPQGAPTAPINPAEGATGHTKQLLSAMAQLHQATETMVDPAELKLMRTIIILLTRLIENDQKRAGIGPEMGDEGDEGENGGQYGGQE